MWIEGKKLNVIIMVYVMVEKLLESIRVLSNDIKSNFMALSSNAEIWNWYT